MAAPPKLSTTEDTEDTEKRSWTGLIPCVLRVLRGGEFALPDTARILSHHRRVGLAGERLLELRHVRDDAVDAVAARRMRIGLRHQAERFGTAVLAPDLAPAEEYALLRREAVQRPGRSVAGG